MRESMGMGRHGNETGSPQPRFNLVLVGAVSNCAYRRLESTGAVRNRTYRFVIHTVGRTYRVGIRSLDYYYEPDYVSVAGQHGGRPLLILSPELVHRVIYRETDEIPNAANRKFAED